MTWDICISRNGNSHDTVLPWMLSGDGDKKQYQDLSFLGCANGRGVGRPELRTVTHTVRALRAGSMKAQFIMGQGDMGIR